MVPHPLDRPDGCPFNTRCAAGRAGALRRERAAPSLGAARGPLHRTPRCQPARPARETRADARIADRRARRSQRVLLDVEDLQGPLPDPQRLLPPHGRPGEGRRRRRASRPRPARRSAWSASPAAARHARPRDPARLRADRRRDPLSRAATASAGRPRRDGRARPLKAYRRDIRMIFQDPFSSLNPRMTVLEIVGEPLRDQRHRPQAASSRTASPTLLRRVGLRPEYMRRYPHAFSGGERQRIGIARALALRPAARRRRRGGLGPRRLGAGADPQPAAGPAGGVRPHLSLHLARPLGRRAHLRPGRGDVCRPHRRARRRPRRSSPAAPPLHRGAALGGAGARSATAAAAPSASACRARSPTRRTPPSGCPFHPRCRYATDKCKTDDPPLRPLPGGGEVACHYAEDLSLRGILA